MCSKAVNQKQFKSVFPLSVAMFFPFQSLAWDPFLCCSNNLHAFLPPFYIIVPLDLKVDGRANWVWLKQDVLNLFMPSVSGLRYWTALIAVMVHYISEAFHSRENWHVPYMKTILIATQALKLGGHLFSSESQRVTQASRRHSWYWCQNMPLNHTLIKKDQPSMDIFICSALNLNTDIRRWL